MISPLSPLEHKAAFQRRLLAWFRYTGRDFPWRATRDLYHILVAEKLLQQTVARTGVVEVYEHLLAAYPTPQHLAQADVATIEGLIQPLGFKYRARELVAMAQALVTSYGGVVPDTLHELLSLPGVGDYAARAVLSFALGRDVPVVDTNVARFLYRIYGLPGKLPANPARKSNLLSLAGQLVPPGRGKEFNLAILDLCALICKPAQPKCPDCPVLAYCHYGTSKVAGP